MELNQDYNCEINQEEASGSWKKCEAAKSVLSDRLERCDAFPPGAGFWKIEEMKHGEVPRSLLPPSFLLRIRSLHGL